jgi:hypothetical protein
MGTSAATVLANAAAGGSSNVLPAFGPAAATGAATVAAVPLTMPPAVVAAGGAAATAAVAGNVTGNVTGGVTGGVGGDVRTGESLPGTGNCPPVDPPSWALFAAGLRVGLGPALLSAAAKSCSLVPGFAESAEAAPLTFAGSVVIGVCETAGIAFISTDIASDVPKVAIVPGDRVYFRYLSNQSSVRRIASAL